MYLITQENRLFTIILMVMIVFHFIVLTYTTAPKLITTNYSKQLSKIISVKVSIATPKKDEVIAPARRALPKKKVSKIIAPKVKEQTASKEVKKNLGSNEIQAKYLSQIRKLIDQNKVYPKRAKRLGQEGRLEVEIILNANGEIIQKSYLSKTESRFLNSAAEKIFEKITSFGKIPKEITTRPLKVVVPIEYELI